MQDYQDVFKRSEKKYLITQQQHNTLLPLLQMHMEADTYGRYTIRNVYYDTADFCLIRASLEGPVYKEKLRLRSYGAPAADDNVFVEIKKKYDGVVYKRRIPMKLAQARQCLSNTDALRPDSQIAREIDWFLHFYAPGPKVFITYERTALAGRMDADLRVTFDTRIRWRTQALDLGQGDWGTPLLPPGTVLMEIKIPGAMPLWLSQNLSQLGIFPISFSKYGVCYKEHLADNLTKTGGIICA